MHTNFKKKLLIIVILAFLIYSNILTAPFLFDDERSITNNPTTQNLDASIRNFFPNNTRYLTQLSFAINFSSAKQNTFPYHLTNLLIHILATTLVWQLSSLLLSSKVLKKSQLNKSKEKISFFIALIFLTHPIQTQAVSYISQRSASMSALFYLSTVYFYLKARLSKQKEFFFLSLISGIAGFYSKASVFSLPIMLLSLEYFFFAKKQYKTKFILAAFGLLASLAIIGFTIIDKSESQRIKISPLGEEITSYNYALTQSRVMVKYIQLLFLPVRQSADYYFPVSNSLADPAVVISSIILLSVLLIACYKSNKYPLLTFSVFWFFIALSVESSILPIDDVIFEHRLYLPMFGFALFFSVGFWYLLKYLQKMDLYKNLIYLLIVIYSLLTFNRNFVWTNEVKFWSDVIKKAPRKAKGYGALGVAYDRIGKTDEAIKYYEKTLELNPGLGDLYLKLHNNLGFSKSKQGKYDEAVEHYHKVLEVNPNFIQTHINLAQLYVANSKYEKAIVQLEKAAKIKPNTHSIYHNLGVAYVEIENYEKAEKYFLKAYKINPNSLQTRRALDKLSAKKHEG
ncbi:MAG: tetratricopeptide repeat protein [Patescibacteria group bacterium]